jgi:hypothetical protein
MNKEGHMASIERAELISELNNLTREDFKQTFSTIYQIVCDKNTNNRLILREFQMALGSIANWDSEKIKSVVSTFRRDKLRDMLRDMSHLNEDIYGSLDHYETIDSLKFIYECHLNIARDLYTKPFIMYHRTSKHEYQKNILILEKIVKSATKLTLRQLTKKKAKVEEVVEEKVVVAIETPMDKIATVDVETPKNAEEPFQYVDASENKIVILGKHRPNDDASYACDDASYVCDDAPQKEESPEVESASSDTGSEGSSDNESDESSDKELDESSDKELDESSDEKESVESSDDEKESDESSETESDHEEKTITVVKKKRSYPRNMVAYNTLGSFIKSRSSRINKML